jgi:transcriptional regulator with XRE-family HTH domain
MNMIINLQPTLTALGHRLRAVRLERGDAMDVFAERVGVSPSTLRAMEKGSPTVQIGSWLGALWVLDRLDETDRLLQPRASLLDQARAAPRKMRQRAPRRPRTP